MSGVVRRCRNCGTEALGSESVCVACHQADVWFYCVAHDDFIDAAVCARCAAAPPKPKPRPVAAPPVPHRPAPAPPPHAPIAHPVPARPAAAPPTPPASPAKVYVPPPSGISGAGRRAGGVAVYLRQSLGMMLRNFGAWFWIAVIACLLPERVAIALLFGALAVAMVVTVSTSSKGRHAESLQLAAGWGLGATLLLALAWTLLLPVHLPVKRIGVRLTTPPAQSMPYVAPDPPGMLTRLGELVYGLAARLRWPAPRPEPAPPTPEPLFTVTRAANLREQPSRSARVLEVVQPPNPLTLAGATAGAWVKVRSESNEGWIYAPDSTLRPRPATLWCRVRADVPVARVRVGPTREAQVATTVAAGSTCQLLKASADGAWILVVTPNGGRGWVARRLVAE